MTAENLAKSHLSQPEEGREKGFESSGDRSHIVTNRLQLTEELGIIRDVDRVLGVEPASSDVVLREGPTEQALNRKEERPQPPLIWRPRSEPREDCFLSLQKWEGYVTEVRNNSFSARLIDRTQDGPEEEVDEFPMQDVPPDDRGLIKPGAVFYWQAGYRVKRGGQRERVSAIWFRRLPAWTSDELKAAKREATRVGDRIGWK